MNLITWIVVFWPLVSANKSITYLQQYGYLDSTALIDNIESAVRVFQETYGLNVTGLLNQDTLDYMERPRCGNMDELLPFTASSSRKWNKTEISWYLYGTAYRNYEPIIDKAFSLWERHSNLKFKREVRNPTIILEFSNKHHTYYAARTNCTDFDGPGGILGHAYHPWQGYDQTDVHFDKEEDWDFSMTTPKDGKKSFYLTAVHEIGHALGLSHSYVRKSVMWALYELPGVDDLNQYDLDRDDIFAIQYLYGVPKPLPTTTTSTTTPEPPLPPTTTATTTTTQVVNRAVPDLCTLEQKIDSVLIVNQRLYVFYNEYVWILALEPSKRVPEEFKRPTVITDWLTFLPENFTKVSAIYQRPNEEITLFADRYMYVFQFPALNLRRKIDIDNIVGRRIESVDSALVGNSGKTYLFVDRGYTAELNECTLRGKNMGFTSRVLPGVPGKIKSAFRYINGCLYFSTDSIVLEYNEFIGSVTRSYTGLFEVLQITCMRETLLKQLYNVVRFLE